MYQLNYNEKLIKMEKLLILGDIHGKWEKVNRIINHEINGNGLALSTGDLGNYKFEPNGNKTLFFCYGNHESFYYIDNLLKSKEGNLQTRIAGEIFKLNGIKISTFPGVYSERFYENGEKTKYFSKKDLDKVLTIREPIDILIMHEAPFGIGVIKNGKDLGKTQINQVINHLKPKIAFFGHHHFYFEGEYNGIPIIGLDQPHHSYVLLNTNDFSIKKIDASLNNGKYEYSWEIGNS